MDGLDCVHHDVGTTKIAVHQVGDGKPTLFIHGWPLSGMTWRKVAPLLTSRSCLLVDLPGAGETVVNADNDFSFSGQAANLKRLLSEIGPVDVVAHDTGATIARELAIIAPDKIKKMVLINTEIPGHRPPWIELFQKLTSLPGSVMSFQLLLRSRAFLTSSMGFGGCFHDMACLDSEFHALFVQPLIDDSARLRRQLWYLRGIDWALVDGLKDNHAKIASEVLFVWGADDETFPLETAKPMAQQLQRCAGFRVIDNAKLLVHEERPAEVARHVAEFLG